MMKKKLTYEYVKNMFESNGCVLLEKEYVNNRTKMKYICSCGNQSTIIYNSFQQGKRCKQCRVNAWKKSFKLDFTEVKRNIEKHGFKLISETYENNKKPLIYICRCGKKATSNYNRLSKGAGCHRCGYDKNKHQVDYVRKYFLSHGCKWIGEDKEYKTSTSKLTYICKCGRTDKKDFKLFQWTRRCSKCAVDEHASRFSGSNHPNYNSALTEEEREFGRKYEEYWTWRQSVYKRDDFTCVCCGRVRGDLNAHHLESYAANKHLRTVVDNGVTLCSKCHVEFHKNYGYGNNDSLQFNEFMRNKGKSFKVDDLQMSLF